MTDTRHDHQPGVFDEALEGVEIHVEPGNPSVAVTVAVPVDSETLTALNARAAREGRDVQAVIADALHAAA
jgi:hypothetical protein